MFKYLPSALVCHRHAYCAFNAVRQAPEEYNEILDEMELIRNTFVFSFESRTIIDELILGFVQELWIVAFIQENLTAAGLSPFSRSPSS